MQTRAGKCYKKPSLGSSGEDEYCQSRTITANGLCAPRASHVHVWSPHKSRALILSLFHLVDRKEDDVCGREQRAPQRHFALLLYLTLLP